MVTDHINGLTVLSIKDPDEWWANAETLSEYGARAISRLWGTVNQMPYCKTGVKWLVAFPDTPEGRALLEERPPLTEENP